MGGGKRKGFENIPFRKASSGACSNSICIISLALCSSFPFVQKFDAALYEKWLPLCMIYKYAFFSLMLDSWAYYPRKGKRENMIKTYKKKSERRERRRNVPYCRNQNFIPPINTHGHVRSAPNKMAQSFRKKPSQGDRETQTAIKSRIDEK